jgi:hypothetical protein
MLSRRARLSAAFSITALLLLFALVVLIALGSVAENVAVTALQNQLAALPWARDIIVFASRNPPYAFLSVIGLAILMALCADLIASRTAVDIGLTEIIVKPMYDVTSNPSKMLYSGLTLFFINLSRHSSATSVATDVTALITIWGAGIRTIVHGVWTVTTTASAVGAADIPVRTWTFKPNDEPGKIELCRLPFDQRDVILFCQETILFEPGRASLTRNPKYTLNPGEYLVRIRLRGVGAKSTHWARVINDGRRLIGEPLNWWTWLYRWTFILVRLGS